MIKTESAGGVVTNKGLVLVVSQHGTSWSLPKGHIDRGEDRISTAKREIYEETRIKVTEMKKYLGSYRRYRIGKDKNDDKNELKTIHMFLFSTTEEKLRPVDPENPVAKWVPKEDVPKLLTHKKDREFFLRIADNI